MESYVAKGYLYTLLVGVDDDNYHSPYYDNIYLDDTYTTADDGYVWRGEAQSQPENAKRYLKRELSKHFNVSEDDIIVDKRSITIKNPLDEDLKGQTGFAKFYVFFDLVDVDTLEDDELENINWDEVEYREERGSSDPWEKEGTEYKITFEVEDDDWDNDDEYLESLMRRRNFRKRLEKKLESRKRLESKVHSRTLPKRSRRIRH